jgi:serine/threonine-protein kinase RsbW
MAGGDRVVLTVPARGEFARTVRMTAAELATRSGMGIDDIEDVRLAVEESFVFAVERVSGPDLTFTFDVAPGEVVLAVAPLVPGCATDEAPDRVERYARFILESICDEFEIVDDAGSMHLRLVKRSA